MILHNILFSLFMSLVLILPDFILNIFWKNYYMFTSKNTLKELIITILIGFIISFFNKKNKIIFFTIFLLLAFIQILNFAYFRTYLMPYQIDLVFSEYKDILDSLVSIKMNILIACLMLIVYFYLFYLITRKLKLITKNFLVFILIILFLIFPFFMLKKKSIYIPNSTHFSYLNTLFAVDLFVIGKFLDQKKINYKPYKITKVDEGKPIVIMVMGESLNYKRMHLYGWDINNTPRLDQLKADKNFIFKKAISSGINTPVSIVTFFNNKREPKNIELLFSQKVNILKLAKENNYSTYWLSMQEEGTSISTILNYADVKKTRKDFKAKYDNILLNNLEIIDFSKKSFIVLHFRANHSPYEKYIPDSFYKWKFIDDDYHKYKVNSYYDSILYIDYLISSIIEYMKNNHKNFVLYFTSDHGEMLGFEDEGGRYGHSQLVWGDTYVPFIYYSDKYHKKLDKKYYNHYMISKMLTRDLGYNIINPNENGKYYINGVQIDGSAGWIEYNIKDIDEK